jgi:glycosyltransferase involved in cell wall biosynthesis
MRVAYDARPLMEKGTGIGRYVRCLLEALVGLEETGEILLWSPREIAKGSILARDPRVKAQVQRGWKGNVWLQFVVPFLVQRHGPDIFHGTLFLSPLAARCPYVVNIYDLTVYRTPDTMEARSKWPLKLLLPSTVARADRILTPSEFTKQEIGARWPQAARKIRVIPGAPCLCFDEPSVVLPGEDAAKVLGRYGVRTPYLLYVGTMEPRKNIVRMLKAFESLHAMGAKDIQFVLVGHRGWGYEEVHRAWESSPVRSSIRYIGYVPDEVLALLYRHALVFLYLSLYEGFGLPPLEAMAAGTCVVASNRASLPECCGEGAVLADPFDVEGLAGILLRLLRDSGLREEYVRKGLVRAKSYNWRESAEKTLAVYRELIRIRSGPSP